jgi:signal peptidase II
MSKNSKIIYLIITTLFFIVFNFYFSDIILKNGYLLPENPVFDITYIQNQGAAFNIFDGYKIFLIAFSAAALGALIFYAVKHITKISVFGLFFTSLLLSGIFNNMCERLFFGYVRDYIRLNFVNFPVFNMSDIFINIGVLGLIFIILKNNYLKK